MVRTALTLVAVAGLSAWASAQTAPGLTAQGRLDLLGANRGLLDDLLDQGLKLSAADDTLTRAAECRGAARVLKDALDVACRDADPDRVAELSEYLSEMMVDGLAPTLRTARQEITPESPHFGKLKTLEADVADLSKSAVNSVPAAGPLGEQPRVRDARARLTEAGGRVQAGR